MRARWFVRIGLLAAALLVAAAASAQPLVQIPRHHVTLILVDHLTLTDAADLANESSYACIALISPGLPRAPNPVANLYATVTAGDVVNTRNRQAGLLDRIATGSASRGRITIIRYGEVRGIDKLIAVANAMEFGGWGHEVYSYQGCANCESAVPVSPVTTFGQIIICGVTPIQTGKWWNELTPMVALAPDVNDTMTSATTHTTGLIALRDIAPTVLADAGLPIPDSMTGAPATFVRMPSAGKSSKPYSYLSKMETLTELNERILLWMAWSYGFVGGFGVLGALAVALGRLPRLRGFIRYLVRCLFACPLALLLAPLALWNGWAPMTMATYAALIVLIPAAIGLIPCIRRICILTCLVIMGDAFTGTHLVAMSSLSGYWLSGIRFYGIGNEYMGVLVGLGLVSVLGFVGRDRKVVDGAPYSEAVGRSATAGQSPVETGALEDGTLASANRTSSGGAGRTRPVHAAALAGVAVWFLLITVALSFPAFGAKAGGAIVALAAFIPAWMGLATLRPVRPAAFVWSTLAGFALIFVWTGLAAALGVRETHIQTATAALAHGKIEHIASQALRKARMEVKTILVPGVLLTLAAMIPISVIWRKTPLAERARLYLADRPRVNAIMRAGIGASVPTLLFNDSGIVAIVFIFGAVATNLLYELLGEACESLPSMSAMSASASPSATN